MKFVKLSLIAAVFVMLVALFGLLASLPEFRLAVKVFFKKFWLPIVGAALIVWLLIFLSLNQTVRIV